MFFSPTARPKARRAGIIGLAALVVALVVAVPVSLAARGAHKKEQLSRVTMAVSGNFISYGPYYIALAKNYFEQEGLDVKIVSVNGGAVAAAAVLSGDAQFSNGTTAQYLPLIAQGQPMQMVAPITGQLQTSSVMSKAFAAKHNLTPSSSVAAKVQALKGANVGVTSVGGAISLTLERILELYGVDKNQVNIIAVGNDPGAWEGAMSHGKIDVGFSGVPIPELLTYRGVAIPFIEVSRGTVPQLSGVLDETFGMNAKWGATHQKEVLAFIRAVGRAQNFMHENPRIARDIIWKQGFSSLDKNAFDAAYKDLAKAFYTLPVVKPSDYSNALDFVGKILNQKLDIPLEKAFPLALDTKVAVSLGLKKLSLVAAPRIVGTAKAGRVLRVKKGDWNVVPTSVHHQWQLCVKTCKAIRGATRPTLKIQRAYVGKHVRLVTIATLGRSKLTTRSRKIPIK